MYKTTIVTFYFNLKDLEDATSEMRDDSFYYEKGRETLKLPYPMVIFCDKITYPHIREIRNEYVDESLTAFVVKSLTEYEFYDENYETIKKNRIPYEFYTNSRNTPSYFLATMFKIKAIFLAHKHQYFNTEYYAWIDFGGSHVLRDFATSAPAMLDNPNPKISACYIHYRGGTTDELHSMQEYLKTGGPCAIAGGIITVDASLVEKFYQGVFSIFHELLFNGVGHSEESALTYFYDRHPELWNVYYGDYFSLLSNYHAPIHDYGCIRRYFINKAINKGRKDLASECARQIIATVESGKLVLSETELKEVRDICFYDK